MLKSVGSQRVRHNLETEHQKNMYLGFPGGSADKVCACNAGDPGFHPWVGKIPLEMGMATDFNILAWRIPWTEEPCGLQSTGSQRVQHD